MASLEGTKKPGEAAASLSIHEQVRKVSWTDDKGKTHKIEYQPKLLGEKVSKEWKSVGPENGIFRIMVDAKKWEKIPQAKRPEVIAEIEEQGARIFKQGNLEADAAVKREFPNVAEKVESIVASVFPSLLKATFSSPEGTAKIKFQIESTTYKIECRKVSDGSIQLLILGEKIASGAHSLILRLAQMDLSKKLKQTGGRSAVFYKAHVTEDRERQFKAAYSGLCTLFLPEDETAIKLLEQYRKLVRTSPDSRECAEVKEELLKRGKESKQRMLTAFDALWGQGSAVCEAKKEGRKGIRMGVEMGQKLKERGTPYIMKYYDVKVKGGVIVSAWAEHYIRGDASKLIPTSFPLLTEQKFQNMRLLMEVSETLISLHSTKGPKNEVRLALCACDLKLENIFVTEDGHARMGDFAGIVEEGKPALEKSELYMAPEVRIEGPATTAADIYAFGVMTFLLLYGKIPDKEKDVRAYIARNLNKENKVDALIGEMIKTDPKERPSAEDVWRTLADEKLQVRLQLESEKGNRTPPLPQAQS